MTDILQQIFETIKSKKAISNLHIDSLKLSRFTLIQLSDKSIGSAWNYSINKKYPEEKSITRLWAQLKDKNDPNSLSIKTAILSALSQNLLFDKSLKTRKIKYAGKPWYRPDPVYNILKKCHSILIIGEGGIYPAIFEYDVPTIRIIDLRYNDETELIKAQKRLQNNITKYNFKGEVKLITTMEYSAAIWITGSTLCNNTFKELIPHFKKCKKVILQGPSCSVFPKALFDIGVTDILTPIKKIDELTVQYNEQVFDRNYVHIRPKRSFWGSL
ncbi:MAG: Rossmann-like domain-containing protein [Candidatus Nanoarchaeia archaeon]